MTSLLSKASTTFFEIKEEEVKRELPPNATQIYYDDLLLTTTSMLKALFSIKFILNHRMGNDNGRSFGFEIRKSECPREASSKQFLCMNRYVICEVLPSQQNAISEKGAEKSDFYAIQNLKRFRHDIFVAQFFGPQSPQVTKTAFTPNLHARVKVSEKSKYDKACNDIYILSLHYMKDKLRQQFPEIIVPKIKKYIDQATSAVENFKKQHQQRQAAEISPENAALIKSYEAEIQRGKIIIEAIAKMMEIIDAGAYDELQKFVIVKPYFVWDMARGEQAYVVIMPFVAGIPLDVTFYTPSLIRIENEKESYALMKVQNPSTHGINVTTLAAENEQCIFEGYKIYSRLNTGHLYPPSLPYQLFSTLQTFFAAKIVDGGKKIQEKLIQEYRASEEKKLLQKRKEREFDQESAIAGGGVMEQLGAGSDMIKVQDFQI